MISQPAGFEPARGNPIGFQTCRDPWLGSGVARVTWRAAGCAANLARGRNNWPNDCKTKDAVAGRVEAIREAVHEAVEEVVAGGSSIRLLIRV